MISKFSLKNSEQSKIDFQKEYNTPLDCSVYNYSPGDCFRIARIVDLPMSSEQRKEVEDMNKQTKRVFIGIAYGGLNLFGWMVWSRSTKWGRLTTTPNHNYFIGFYILFNVGFYVMLDQAL